LTGTVRRLAASKAGAKNVEKALTRHGAPSGTHRVELVFDDGARVGRGPNAQSEDGDGLTPSVIKLLRSPEWQHDIGDLSAYLATTHFLSQAAGLRLTSRSPEERWSDLCGPTGGTLSTIIVERLGGGVTRAFNREVEDAEKVLATARRRLEELREIRHKIGEAEALLGIQSALSSAEALQQAQVIAAAMVAIAGALPDMPSAPAEALATVAEALRQARSAVIVRERFIDGAAAVPERWALCISALKEKDRAIDEADTVAQAASVDANDSEHRAAEAEVSLVEARERQASTSKHRNRLDQRLSAFRALREADAESERITQAIGEAATVLDEVRTEKQRLDRDLARLVGIDGEIAAHGKDLSELHGIERRATEVLEAIKLAAETTPELQAVRVRREVMETQYATATRNLEVLNADIRDAEAKFKKLTADAHQRANLIADLLRDLHAQETECPFCCTEFRTHADLVARARSAAEQQDPHLAEVAERLNGLRHTRDEQEATCKELGKKAEVAKHVEANHQQTIAAATELANHFRHLPRVTGRSMEEVSIWVSERIAYVEGECNRLKTERRALDPDGMLSARTPSVVTRVNEAEERHLNESQRLADVGRRRGEALGVLNADADLATLDDAATKATLDGVLQDLARASEGDAAATAAHEKAVAVRQAAATRYRQCVEQLVALRRDREELDQKRLATLGDWAASGLSGDPSLAGLEEARSDVRRRTEELGHLLGRCETAAEGYRRWLADENTQKLRTVLGDMIREEDAADAEECERRLEQRLAEVKRHLDACGKARDLAEPVARTIRGEHSTFIKEVLTPLNHRVDAFSRGWSSFPDRRIDISHRIRYSNSEVMFQALGHQANLILSEGQAGIHSLSFLLAASTAYPWSRWRALLLDDPLQYNDIVHKTAFLDLLRPLVANERYQVLMSTHDLEEARFIGRKCKNAGVPFTLCRLKAISDNGVEYEVE
jgi:exonuclease SbcC